MSGTNAPLQLLQRRSLGMLLTDAFSVYSRHFPTFIALAAAVVLPVQLVVSGIGAERLWGPWDETPDPIAYLLIPAIVNVLVVGPLLAAMTIHALADVGARREPSAVRSIRAGLEVFPAVFAVLLLVDVTVAASVVTVVLPIYLLVRWWLVLPAVILEDRRGFDALRRSAELIRDSWWRAFLVWFVSTFGAMLMNLTIVGQFADLIDLTNSDALAFSVELLGQTIVLPAFALVTAFYYFHLRARSEGVGAPPDPPGLPPRGAS